MPTVIELQNLHDVRPDDVERALQASLDGWNDGVFPLTNPWGVNLTEVRQNTPAVVDLTLPGRSGLVRTAIHNAQAVRRP